MTTIKKLAGQTAVYGLSSIVGRLLNYLLVPFYTRVFTTQEYGVVSEIFAYVSFFTILYTYGMETTFFHFSNKEENKNKVYSTGLISLLVTSVLISSLLILFSSPVAAWIKYPKHPEYISLFALVLLFDTLAALPFAKLRQENRAKRFAMIKLVNIFLNIFFNVFFLVICPWAVRENNALAGLIAWFYDPNAGVEYVFLSLVLASLVTLLLLIPQYRSIKMEFDKPLWKQMILYSFPLLIAGFAGMINETLDRAVYKYLAPDSAKALRELGIYSACYKLSILMSLFVQTFRYAAEPFFFNLYQKDSGRQVYARVMHYFIIACSFIFLVVTLYLDVFKLLIGEKFREGLFVVPILLMANLFLGIFYNLSMWYKLTGQTRFGAYLSIFGAAVTVFFLWILVPRMGYSGAAWATLICYAAMMTASYFWGQKHFPIPYDVPRSFSYIILSLVLFFAYSGLIRILKPGVMLEYIVAAILLAVFSGFVFLMEKPAIKK